MTRERESDLPVVQPPVDEPSVMDRVRLFGGVGGAILLAILLVQNLKSAEIHFLWMSWDIPLVLALIASAVLGALVWALVGFFRHRAQDAAMRAEVRAERRRDKK